MARLAATIADGKKADNLKILETGSVSHLADYFVICSGESRTQVRTIVDDIEHAFRARGLEPLGQERDKSNTWCLLDYGDIVIHVMNSTEREFYQLEHFWSHATEMPEHAWKKENRQAS